MDLIEVRLIETFLLYGVGWKALRKAAVAGAELLGTKHPFASFRFRTDGREMFADMRSMTAETQLLELSKRQHVFRAIIAPALIGVEFDATYAVRWRPLGNASRIVLDPGRAFGKPIGVKSGVPAVVLAESVKAHGLRETAAWYEAEPQEVGDAVRFAERFAA